jgi:hypothetical protein
MNSSIHKFINVGPTLLNCVVAYEHTEFRGKCSQLLVPGPWFLWQFFLSHL